MPRHASNALTELEDNANGSDLEDLIGYNLKRAYMIVQADFRDALGEDGLSVRMFSALSLTVRYPHITQSDLAKMLGIERSGLVAIVDALEEQKYLARAAVPGDRRVQALVPTQAGTDAYNQAIAEVKAHEDRLFADISETDKQTLLHLLKKIRRGGPAI